MERDEVRARLEEAYAARVAGDAARLQAMCREDARFEVVGTKSLIEAYPAAGPLPLQRAAEEITRLVTMTRAEPVMVLIDGHQGAVRLRATVSVGGLDPIETEMCHFWEFDEAGKVRGVTEFLDTARLAQEMAALR